MYIRATRMLDCQL